MARLPADPRRIPWQVVLTVGLRVAKEVRERYERLSERERREFTRILRKSRGRAGNLTERERRQVRELAWKAVGPDRR